MDEEQKKQIAIFRFGVISDFVNRPRLQRGEKTRLLREKSARSWDIPFSSKTRIAPSTICDWIRAYHRSGGRLEGLYPKDRSDQGQLRAMDEELAQSLIRLRQEMPQASIPTLIEEMTRRGVLRPGLHLARSTVYRFLHHHGLVLILTLW